MKSIEEEFSKWRGYGLGVEADHYKQRCSRNKGGVLWGKWFFTRGQMWPEQLGSEQWVGALNTAKGLGLHSMSALPISKGWLFVVKAIDLASITP